IAFWSLVKSDPAIAAVHAQVYAATRAQLETLLLAAVPEMPPARARLAAISLTALVDGLWLELCLDPSTFSAEEAQAMVERAMMLALGQWRGEWVDQSDRL
ncbi:MAG: TetR family transcriptional regulator C-terminal domain-containing protein, partial [Alphaproteobacteria bacterium]